MFFSLLAAIAFEALAGTTTLASPTTFTTVGTYASPPKAPAAFVITRRDHASVDVRWVNQDSASAAVVEKQVGTSWTVVRTLGSQTAGVAASATNLAAATDAKSCFRARLTNAFGSTWSVPACAFTLDARYASLQRVQLELTTASSADPQASVSVGLQAPYSVVQYPISSNQTWIVRDLRPGSGVQTFDLEATGVANPSAITEIRLTPETAKNTCVSRVGLRVDGKLVYQRSWTTCVNMSASAPLVISHALLRGSSLWTNVGSTGTPGPLDFSELMGALDARIGASLHDTSGADATWWRGYPSYAQLDDYRIEVQLPLQTSYGNLDATFDLVLDNDCVAGNTTVSLRSENTDVDAATWWNLLAWLASELAEDAMPSVSTRIATIPGCSQEFFFLDNVGIFVRSY